MLKSPRPPTPGVSDRDDREGHWCSRAAAAHQDQPGAGPGNALQRSALRPFQESSSHRMFSTFLPFLSMILEIQTGFASDCC